MSQKSTSKFGTSYSNWKEEESYYEQEHPERLIDQELVFKSAMSSNYSKIIELLIVKEEVTKIDAHNAILK